MRHFFYPESIAVFGASDRPSNLAGVIVRNLIRFGFRGDIFPIGNNEGFIEGRRIFTDLAQVERAPDLAVLLVSAPQIPALLDACGRKGTRHVIIESAGFTELGEDKKGLENEILAIASKWGIAFQGPNCFGVMNIEEGVVLPFFKMEPDSVKTGVVSFIGQSGGIFFDTSMLCSVERVGLNKLASIGNKLNLNENDFLEYLIADPGTKVIGMYLENFSDGRRLMDLAAGTDKPIVLVKGNRSRESREIAHFHTTALAGSDRTADAAMTQAGIHRVQNMREMIDGLKIFSMPLLKGPNLAIMTRSGGHGVLSADGVERYGFKLAKFPEALVNKIGENKKHVIRMTNPLDVGDIYDMTTYPGIVEMMLKEEGVDGVVYISTHSAEGDGGYIENLIRESALMAPLYGKPVVLCMVADKERWFSLKEAADIPVFSELDDALYALSWSLAHFRYQTEKAVIGPWTAGGVKDARLFRQRHCHGPGRNLHTPRTPRSARGSLRHCSVCGGGRARGRWARLSRGSEDRCSKPASQDGRRRGRPRSQGRGGSERSGKPYEGGALSRPKDGLARPGSHRGRKGRQRIRTGRGLRSRRHLRGAARDTSIGWRLSTEGPL